MSNVVRVYNARNPIPEKFYWGHPCSEKPKQLLILCHGFRNNGHNMYELASSWASQLPGTAFVAPTAPFRRISRLWGLAKFVPVKIKGEGFVWYQMEDRLLSAFVPGVGVAANILNHFIDEELQACALPPDACALVGFSQGAIIALEAGLRRHAAPKGVVAISGAMLNCGALAKEIKNHCPVILSHSEDDDVIPIDAVRETEKTLKALGVPVEAIYFKNMLHDNFGQFPHRSYVQFLSDAFSNK